MLLARPARAAEVHVYHQQAMPQRENACAAFALTCLLRGMGFARWRGYEIDQELTAYLAGMVALEDAYPFDADPGTAAQAGWGFVRRYAYPLRRTADLAEVGTSPEGVAAALETLTGGALTAVPVKGRRRDGSPLAEADVWGLVDCILAPEHSAWEAQVLFNYQVGHLAALEGPGQGWGHVLFGEETRPCTWNVGHVTSLAGVAACHDGGRALVIRDSSPRFGWRGYHAQPAGAVAAALARNDGSEGGVLVVCRAADGPGVRAALAAAVPGVSLDFWNNGSRFVSPPPLPPREAGDGNMAEPAGEGGA